MDENRYRRAEGQLDLFDDPTESKWPFRTALAIVLVVVAALFATALYAEEPRGFPDQQEHARWHHVYMEMTNQMGVHCCPQGSCRPTVAKYENGAWYAKVDGIWTEMRASRFVREHKYSWSETAHVCASQLDSFSSFGYVPPYIWCFVPPGFQG